MSKPDWNRLDIRLIGCRKHNSRINPTGEFVALFAVKDPETGEEGHFFYEFEWEKRDVMHEAVYTDNPALVVEDDESPSCYSVFDPHQDDQGEEPQRGDCSIDAWTSSF